MFTRIRRWRPDPYLLLLLALTLFALTPLLSPNYFYGAHDGRHSVFFVAMFDEAIRDGALWPIWAMHHNQGYGYPTFLLQAPLAFYVAEGFALLGVGITAAVKGAWTAAFLLSAWGMYGLVRRWVLTWPHRGASLVVTVDDERCASQAGLIAGLLYVYAPYHLLDIYVRAALAETMLIGWLPWIFWAFDRLIGGALRPGWQARLAVAALAYALLIFTHAFAIIAVTPLLMVFILFRLWVQWRYEGVLRGKQWAAVAGQTAVAATAGVAGLLLAAIFVLPLLVEGPLLSQEDWVRDTYVYSRHFVHWGQFLSPFWGFGYSDDPVGANDGMGFQLGVMLATLAVAALYLLLVRMWRTRSLPVFLLAATAALLYLMTPDAGWLWRSMALLEVLQFPWRLLTLVIFVLSALGGLAMNLLLDSVQRQSPFRLDEAGSLVIAVAVLLASAPYIRPASLETVEPWREDGRAVFQFERQHPDMLGYTTLVQERFTESPLTAQYAASFEQDVPFDPDQLARLGILAGEGVVTDNYSRGHHFGGVVRMRSSGVVQIRLFAFPGWQVRLNGELVDYRVSPPHGVIEIDVPAGEHRIDVAMGATPVRTAGAIISGLTLLAMFGLLYVGVRSADKAGDLASNKQIVQSTGTQ
ncbi:MAG: hypothetical protein ACK4SA_00145 [Caldilinea sp.]